MSGIYIHDMEMQKTCYDCPMNVIFSDGDIDWHYECCLLHDHIARYADLRLPDCPLVPVPPHGRLIDADALRAEVKKHATPSDAWVFSLIRTAPTIIPADKEVEG